MLCNDDYNDYYGSYCPYLVLLLITCCFYYDDNYDDHADFSRMRSEGFPFIVGGLGVGPLFAASWSARRFRVVFRVVNSVSIGEAAKPRVFCCVDVAVSIGEAAKRRAFCYVDVAVSIGEAAKPRVFCYVDVAVSIG